MKALAFCISIIFLSTNAQAWDSIDNVNWHYPHISFDHALHVETLNTECTACHSDFKRPAMAQCATCHVTVDPGCGDRGHCNCFTCHVEKKPLQ